MSATKRKRGKDFWGPPAWRTIHSLAITLKSSTGSEFVEFLWLLTHLLPCDYCKKNLEKKLRANDPRQFVDKPSSAFLFTYIIHDLANQHITRYHPSTPKSSPPFDDVKNYYINITNRCGAWCSDIWTTIHTFAATLRPENGEYYKRFLEVLVHLLPKKSGKALFDFLRIYPVTPYLRNNHDAFFYTYKLHDFVNQKTSKTSPSYRNVKSFYFSGLGEECSECQV